MIYYCYKSPIGNLCLSASNEGVCAVRFHDCQSEPNDNSVAEDAALAHIKNTIIQLDEYFEGKLSKFSLPLVLSGTTFQNAVWNALQQIPYGQTVSYKNIAQVIGNVKASRAVGMANNRNPLPIIIPCHRVIGQNGAMVGYAGQIWRKEWLLKHERQYIFD